MATTAIPWTNKSRSADAPLIPCIQASQPRQKPVGRWLQSGFRLFAMVLTCTAIHTFLTHRSVGFTMFPKKHAPNNSPFSIISWQSCGPEYGSDVQCADVAVPLDYRNISDGRTLTLAVARMLAFDKKNRKGAIFLNPGGPGGPGTYTAKRGQALARVVKGQYDLIGFDPRGVGGSRPYVSCFASALDLEAFGIAADDFSLNLPANFSAFSPYLRYDFERQVSSVSAYMTTVAKHCVERSGDLLPYLGTEYVVRDIDFLSRLIEGEDVRINYWGFSYGTVIGQYLVKVLSPERLGRIVIDSVVDVSGWNTHADHFFEMGAFKDVNNLLWSFASSCLQAGSTCALTTDESITSVHTLLAKIEVLLDALYTRPVPVFGLDIPAVATTADLRTLLFHSMYQPRTWVDLAKWLNEAFRGDFTNIVKTTMPRVHRETTGPDSSIFSTHGIACADAAPYTDTHPPPTDEALADMLFKGFGQFSRTYGDGHWSISLCHLWTRAGMKTTRSHYNGTFELADNTLDTPMLILTNTFDPITPLSSAVAANERLGNNARLIQQTGGWGHCTASHPSDCTALATSKYFVNGELPVGKYTTCAVNRGPFDSDDFAPVGDQADVLQAWREFAESTEWVSKW